MLKLLASDGAVSVEKDLMERRDSAAKDLVGVKASVAMASDSVERKAVSDGIRKMLKLHKKKMLKQLKRSQSILKKLKLLASDGAVVSVVKDSEVKDSVARASDGAKVSEKVSERRTVSLTVKSGKQALMMA